MVTPSRLLPAVFLRGGVRRFGSVRGRGFGGLASGKDVDSQARKEPIYAWGRELGRSLYLVDGLRIVQSDDGHIERADQRLPRGETRAIELPPRLGGGYLFWQVTARGTHLWRAKEWEGRLKSVASVLPRSQQVIAGFDRIYLRTKRNAIIGVDLEDGRLVGRGGLPDAPLIGSMAFADGWRGAVLASVRGPLITFDAGKTWRSVHVAEAVTGVGVRQGDPMLFVNGGAYRVDSRGVVHRVDSLSPTGPGAPSRAVRSWRDPMTRWRRGLLRAAVERGVPNAKNEAVVLKDGHLARVQLPSGRVVAWRPNAVAERESDCEGLRVGSGYGFLCGRRGGPTTVYRLAPSLELKTWARFDSPRYVASTGGGALVVRGVCASQGPVTQASGHYCIIDSQGRKREIKLPEHTGTERVVALKDGRVAVLEPPRREPQPEASPKNGEKEADAFRAGRLILLDGDATSSVALRFPKAPPRELQLVREGLWVHGFRQDAAGHLAGWVEGGRPLLGIRVNLDGEVTFGELFERGGQVLLAGRFALATNGAQGAEESTDGGFHWRRFDLPKLPQGSEPARACSAVGCALASWLRIGWGNPSAKDDLKTVELPPFATHTPTLGAALRLRCVPGNKPKQAVRKGLKPAVSAHPHSAWTGLLGEPPPPLPKHFEGVDRRTDVHAATAGQIYVWGPRGADWARRGLWLIRYEDGLSGQVHETAPSPSPWSDLDSAALAIGAKRGGGFRRWRVWPEASREGALATMCRGASCRLFALQAGQPIQEISMPTQARGHTARPIDGSVVRLGDDWYWLVSQRKGHEIWRARDGEARLFKVLPSYLTRLRSSDLSLLRSHDGSGMGLLFTRTYDLLTRGASPQWVLLPVHRETGDLGEPIDLGTQAFTRGRFSSCRGDEAGWIFDGELKTAPVIRMKKSRGHLNKVAVRLRLAPDNACIEALSAVSWQGLHGPARGKARPSMTSPVPLLVRKTRHADRWRFECELLGR